MVVSMLDIVMELPESTSLKDKRRVVSSLKTVFGEHKDQAFL